MTTKNEKLKQVLQESNLDSNSKQAILEEWNNKLGEAREKIADDLREEFAAKYEHDKQKMVEAQQRLIHDTLKEELEELAVDKKEVVKERVNYQTKIKEHAKQLEQFMLRTLASEIKEFKEDRKQQQGKLKVLESFVTKNLAKEIREFKNDADNLSRTKAKQLIEHKRSLQEARRNIIRETARSGKKFIRESLRKELGQYKDDIEQAKKNEFGRKLYEAFAAEFMTTYMDENSEMHKLKKRLNEKNQEIEKTRGTTKKAQYIVEKLNKKAKALEERLERERILNKLLSPLPRAKQKVMSNLLEHYPSNKLQEAYNRYLPTVTGEETSTVEQRRHLQESRRNNNTRKNSSHRKTYDGNKRKINETLESQVESKDGLSDEERKEINEITALSGLNNN